MLDHRHRAQPGFAWVIGKVAQGSTAREETEHHRLEGAENLCHLGKWVAERGRAPRARPTGLGLSGGAMIFGLWA
jgi:hypothetical protein